MRFAPFSPPLLIAILATGCACAFPLPNNRLRCSWFISCSTFSPRCFLFAVLTDASQLDIDPFDAAHLGDLPRHREPIHCVAVKIANHSALRADEVVVPLRVGFKPCPVSHRADTGYYAAILEESQCSIDSVDRNGRNLLSHTHEDCLGVGVFLATGQLPKNLGSLMSCLDALTAADLQELRNAFLDLFSGCHPKYFFRNYSYLVIIRHLGAACKHNFNINAGGWAQVSMSIFFSMPDLMAEAADEVAFLC